MTIRALVMGDGVLCYGALEIVGLLLLLLLLLLLFPVSSINRHVQMAISWTNATRYFLTVTFWKRH